MDQDQPQIPSQDPRPLPNAPPKAIPIAPLVIQPIPKVENPFKLKDNELSRYISCTSCQPWTPPQKYREMKESDDAAKYLAHKKAYENKPPSIANIITSLSPPIIRRSNCQGHLLLAGFTKGHQETLSRLYSLIRSDGEWGGIYMLLQRNNMIHTRYDMDPTQHSISLNHVEAHRRILNMEKACADFTEYISETIEGAYACIRQLAMKPLADAYAVLKSDHVQAAQRIAKFASTAPSDFTDRAEWLKGNRTAALTRKSILTELDWGLPLLGLFHSLSSSMDRLDEEKEAQMVLATITDFLDKRAMIYTKDVEPLVLYGIRLTEYTTQLQTLCRCFTGLGNKARVSLPRTGFHELDRDGRVLGPDGRAAPLGLHTVIPGRERWLIPFPIVDIPGVTGAEELFIAHAKEEMDLVSAMLRDLKIKSPSILSYKKIGNERVKTLLSTDTFRLKNTSILPPSASMPSAWYQPDGIFAPVETDSD